MDTRIPQEMDETRKYQIRKKLSEIISNPSLSLSKRRYYSDFQIDLYFGSMDYQTAERLLNHQEGSVR